jgi:hypothetical protein
LPYRTIKYFVQEKHHLQNLGSRNGPDSVKIKIKHPDREVQDSDNAQYLQYIYILIPSFRRQPTQPNQSLSHPKQTKS